MKTLILASLLALTAVATTQPAGAGSPPGHTGYVGR